MELVASYVVGSGGSNADPLTTQTFTPDPGELIVVKVGNEDDDNPDLTGVSGGGLVWSQKAAWLPDTGNNSDSAIYTARVGTTSAAMTVTSTWQATAEGVGVHAMIVERWTGADVAAAPPVNAVKTGTGAPSATLASTQYGSAVTWVNVDWNSAAGTPIARSVDGEIVREYTPSGQYLTPFVSSRSSGLQNTDTTLHVISLPPGRAIGEMLLVVLTTDNVATVTLTSGSAANGWQILGSTGYGAALRQTVAWKIADGNDALGFNTADNQQSTHLSFSIPNADDVTLAQASGMATGQGGGTTTIPTAAVVTGRTVGGNDTAASSHTVPLPSGVTTGEAALVLFGNDTATALAATSSAGWQVLDTQGQGATTNHRGTLFYAANAATAAALVVNLTDVSAGTARAEEAAWAAFRIAGSGGTPYVSTIVNVGTGVAGGSGTTFTPSPITGLPAGDYTTLLLAAVDSSTDTALSQTITWGSVNWINTQTRRPATAGTSAAPEVFTAEQRITGIAANGSITPAAATLSLTEQYLCWTVALVDGSTSGSSGATSATADPPAVTAPGASGLARLFLTALSLDTSAVLASAQTLTAPGGFGTITRQNPTTASSALTATAETTSTNTTVDPGPWTFSDVEEFVTATIVITGTTAGAGGGMRMYAGINYDPAALQPIGTRTFGMTAPSGQAWTILGIELLPAPIAAALGVIEEFQEAPALSAGRLFVLGVVEEVADLPELTAARLVAGPVLDLVDEVEDLPPLTVTRQLPVLGTITDQEELPAPLLSRIVELGAVEEIQDAPDVSGGSTSLSPVTMIEEVPPVTVGFGGIDVAASPARRGLPPVVIRGGIRIMSQNIITGRWTHRELPVEDLQITRTLSGPQVINGMFSHEITDLRDVNLMPWGSWIHVEEAGDIRASGILMPGSYSATGALELQAMGVSHYANRIPYTGEFRAIRIDPAEIVRTLWAQLQSFPRGDLGVTVVGSTPVRMGTPESAEVVDTEIVNMKAAAKYIVAHWDAGGAVFEDLSYTGNPDVVRQYNTKLVEAWQAETAQYPDVIDFVRYYAINANPVVTVAGEPWVLHGYELPMIGATIDQLGEEAPFEYVEEQGWVDSRREAVWHRIRIGYPRVGSRLDLNLTQGENLLEHAPFEEPDDTYADSAFVTGKGEGADGVYGYAGINVPSRLRLPRVVTDKTIATQQLATARAHEEVAAALSTVEEIPEIAVNIRHPNSLWGTFDVGDEVLPRIRVPWLGTFAQWHRITQLTYAPDSGYASCKLSRRDAYRTR